MAYPMTPAAARRAAKKDQLNALSEVGGVGSREKLAESFQDPIKTIRKGSRTYVRGQETGLLIEVPKPLKSQIKRKKTRRKKSLSNSKLESLRWESFAAVIRERDADKGCFSCSTGKAESAGHIISRRKLATKYDERCVNGQCLSCNWSDKFRPGYHDLCVSAFISQLGLDVYQDLVERSGCLLQESRAEIISSAWGYVQRMKDGERKEKIRRKLAPLVPVAYGGEK